MPSSPSSSFKIGDLVLVNDSSVTPYWVLGEILSTGTVKKLVGGQWYYDVRLYERFEDIRNTDWEWGPGTENLDYTFFDYEMELIATTQRILG